MAELVELLLEDLSKAKTELESLQSSTRALSESLKTLMLENARLMAVNARNGEVALEDYTTALKLVYGITITDDPSLPSQYRLSYEALRNYQEGLDVMSEFFEDTYATSSVLDYDHYILLKSIMGNLTVKRVSDNNLVPFPDDLGEDAKKIKGYTTGHTIYDIFDTYKNYMSPDNLIHELFHGFGMFSGFGGQRLGSMLLNSDLISYVSRNEVDIDHATPIPDLLEERNGVRRQNFGIVRDKDGKFIGFDTSELLADLGLFAARGLIDDPYILNQYKIAIRQSILAHTNPLDYIHKLGVDKKEVIEKPLIGRSILRFNTASSAGVTINPTTDREVVQLTENGLNHPFAFDRGTNLTILGRTSVTYQDSKSGTQEYYWFYVATPSIDVDQIYSYGWVRQDLLGYFDETLPSELNYLPEINFEATDPIRPFNEDDMFNPPLLSENP